MNYPNYDRRAKSLEDMMHEVYAVNVEKGWRGADVKEVSFGEAMALLHSEVSEALEAYRTHGVEDFTREDGKPEGVGSEFADVLIRLLDDCHMFGIDLQAEYERKIAFNRTRAYRHGNKAL